ncbi:hypothetical protein QR680_014180 [Steinernema hermaphroditum]|uniref:Uncharacterized protein n=1 Tax=Steinernema hermaphroditum TaxID=289476 RepID=A0AA39IA34_9BILA|nr:hypothetical protein QR680_014180 [Steinernema hermaphroditum]
MRCLGLLLLLFAVLDYHHGVNALDTSSGPDSNGPSKDHWKRASDWIRKRLIRSADVPGTETISTDDKGNKDQVPSSAQADSVGEPPKHVDRIPDNSCMTTISIDYENDKNKGPSEPNRVVDPPTHGDRLTTIAMEDGKATVDEPITCPFDEKKTDQETERVDYKKEYGNDGIINMYVDDDDFYDDGADYINVQDEHYDKRADVEVDDILRDVIDNVIDDNSEGDNYQLVDHGNLHDDTDGHIAVNQDHQHRVVISDDSIDF